jgi:hypothetical protein
VRAVFLTLLSANLLFLAWAKWIDTPRDAGSADALSRLPRLKLVTEAPATSKPTSEVGQKMAYHIPDPAQTSQNCTSIGPFGDITTAARVAGMLHSRGYNPTQRAEEGETVEGYWVFVGGAESEDDAAQLVARLEMKGFTDAHVMKNFSTNRRISVGMFSTRARAEKRAAAISSLGLQPEIGERKFPGTVYWVDVVRDRGDPALPPEYSFAEVGHSKVVMQDCPVARPAPVPEDSEPGDGGDGITKSLPRTTVASAPSGKQ